MQLILFLVLHPTERWVFVHGDEKKLPGLEFTQRQLFWLSNARGWYEKLSFENFLSIRLHGIHSPGELRVNVVLQNRPEFAKDFNCPLGAAMNPSKKCDVW